MSTEISFGMFDVTAKEDSAPSCADVQPFVNLAQLKQIDLQVPPYMTGERNHNVLDGTMKLFPDAPATANFGLWSGSMTGADGRFAVPPSLTIDFAANHSSLGLTFRFAEATGDYCNDISIKWLDGIGAVLADVNFAPDSAKYFAAKQISDYRKLQITFRGTNRPYRYLKVAEIMYGVMKIFGDDSLIKANILEEIDPLSSEISVNTLDLTIHTKDFAILDMTGMYELLQKKQRMDVVEVMDNGAKKDMGTFYLDEPECENDDTTNMSCIDLIGVIDQANFKGGMYSNVTAGAIVSEIMASAKTTLFVIDPTLSTMALSGWIPICTHREALQQVAFAIGAIVDCSRSDKIRIYPMPAVVAGTIAYADKFDDHKLKLGTLVTGVEVISHTYIATQEQQELLNAALPIGTQEITFSQPMHSLTVSGAVIVASGANYAKLSMATAGTVILTGKSYADNTALYGVYAPDLPANEKANILKIEDATLVGPGTTAAVAQRVYSWYQNRYADEGSIDLTGQEPGEIWGMDSMNSRQLQGLITSLDIDLTGGFVGKMKLTGKAVTP